MGKGKNCCKKDEKASNVTNEPAEGDEDCCVFKPTKTLAGELPGLKLVTVPETVRETENFPQLIAGTFTQPDNIPREIVRDLSSSYLQNCVFLL
jgi:hypothetical protein